MLTMRRKTIERDMTPTRQWLGAMLVAAAFTFGAGQQAMAQAPVQRGVRVGDNISAVNGAAVTAGGIVSAAENSTVTVTTAAPAGKVAKVTVRKITDVAMTSFAVSGDAEANNGTDKTYTIADIVPSYADLTSVTWSVEDGTGSATIGETTGVLHPTGLGTVTITATDANNSSFSASKEVTIVQGRINITGVSLDKSEDEIFINNSYSLSKTTITPTVTDTDAWDMPSSPTRAKSSSIWLIPSVMPMNSPLKPSIIECVTCEYILPISSVWIPRLG